MTTEAMNDAQALAAVLAETAAARAGDHPPIDQLADYLADALAPDAAAVVQDHLVACRACAAKLLDLETLAEPGPETAEGVTDLAVAAGWREQKSRLAALDAARRRQRTLRWASAVAASFFVATLGLSAWVAQLRTEIAGYRAPEVNPPNVFLDVGTTRNGADPAVVEFGPGDRSATLILTPTRTEAWSAYDVEILDASGAEVWSGRDLAASDDFGTLRLLMRRSQLPAADYEVRLHGVDGDRREQLLAAQLLVRER